MSAPLIQAKRVVVKLGTGILTSGIGKLNTERIAYICQHVKAWRDKGLEVIIVSSGAVGLGMGKLNLTQKPTKIRSLQKCAAIGQILLYDTWQACFEPYGLTIGQLLLTRDNLQNRERHVAVRELIDELLTDGIIPVINENDSISADELKFGDNDILSAMVSSMTRADILVILSTAPGVIDMQGDGKIIPVIEKITPEIEALAQGTTSVTGTGGMITKIQAAELATKSGCGVFIGSGNDPDVLKNLLHGKAKGTLFIPKDENMQSRKRWIAFFHKPEGSVIIDEGAEQAVCEKGSSLLAKGIVGLENQFHEGNVIAIKNQSGKTIAQGISEYSASDLQSILGLPSETIREHFPDRKNYEAVHRDSLVTL